MMGKRYTAQEMIDAITEARGFVTAAADKLGCSRRTVYRYINNYATVAEAVEDAREKRHDFVENKLMSAINDGNVTAIIFYLKTQCKTRGYVERYQQEITGADGGPVVIRWPEDKDGD
jgi:alkanesulfonate monooxygenase SsuD/methylene tetrahydromethanopterin reductase-like flavin-dependent oxidoreductase (luciferase family)